MNNKEIFHYLTIIYQQSIFVSFKLKIYILLLLFTIHTKHSFILSV